MRDSSPHNGKGINTIGSSHGVVVAASEVHLTVETVTGRDVLPVVIAN